MVSESTRDARTHEKGPNHGPHFGKHPPWVAIYRCAAMTCILSLMAAPGPAAGDSAGPSLRLSGYGEINYWHFDYGPNQKSLPEGSAPDSRALIDVTRLALELEAELLPDVELEAEVEFEHGGTGGALELEYEEFGEFEQEVEKGGE